MNLSYWEIKSWFSNIDYAIVGSGIVGLNCALYLKQQHPNANILILEKGTLPQGASTKNAGFACFGSLSEILNDLEFHSEEEVLSLVKQRVNGLRLLRENLGDSVLDYAACGGYELFSDSDTAFYETCLFRMDEVNHLLKPVFNYDVFQLKSNPFGFKNIYEKLVFNVFEGQLDTGKMMEALLRKVQAAGVKILNNISVEAFSELNSEVAVKTNQIEFNCKKLILANNGFSSLLLNEPVKPARAQVLITKPIKNLNIKGTFHLDRGYYYFRNIDNRILFGGGRQLDFKAEETTEFGETKKVQDALNQLLKHVILPETPFEVDHTWSGIMGVGNQKKAIIKQVSDFVYCGIRMGGMGVAIGSYVGKSLANLSGKN
ncbi:NAD(P)/FAD-dependent oxidoreductase [Formosa sp. S-31]|uniref:NAD(P)/FAD-dependent oxidoreductase n=1 Tax=Formosa sp. S-31 TaxID=2790949 RepID=UPI003EB8915E